MRNPGAAPVRLVPLLLLPALLATPFGLRGLPAADGEAPEERRFVIRVRGADAGYGRFRVTTDKDGASTIEGETLLKLLQHGQETLLRCSRTTRLAAGDRMPREYRASISRDGQTSEYVCRREGDLLVEDSLIRGAKAHVSLKAGASTGILDYNAPEHFELFLRGRADAAKAFVFGALVPEMMSVLPLTGKVFAAEDTAVDGGTVRARRVDFSALGILYRGWLDADGRLARVEVPSQGFVALRTTRRIEDLDLRAADLVRSFTVPLRLGEGVRDPGEERRTPGAVREARFRVHVKVGENRMDADVLTNSHQRFVPTTPAPAEPGWLDGRLSVRPKAAGALPAAGASSTDLSPFLAPEDSIEAAAPEIRERAAELVPAGTPPFEAARRVADWVHRNVRYETQLVSALAAHQGRVGDCLSMSRLAVALLRALRVPARVIGGIALGSRRRLGQHHWVEVHGGPAAGWLQLDPTYGQSTGVDAFHLDLWREGTLDGSAENWVELEGWEPAAGIGLQETPRSADK